MIEGTPSHSLNEYNLPRDVTSDVPDHSRSFNMGVDVPSDGTSDITPASASALDATPTPYEGTEAAEAPLTVDQDTVDTKNDAMRKLHQATNNLANTLADRYGAPRTVPYAEDRRVDAILDEPQLVRHPRAIVNAGRAVLVKAGLRRAEGVDPQEQKEYEERVAIHTKEAKEELDYSREILKSGIREGLDDVLVDRHLGIREADNQEPILPPFIRQLHKQAEETAGHEITFTKWLTDHATDEQLTNVWQWHDHYLDGLDNAPEFIEQVDRVKYAHIIGTARAIAQGQLHEGMRVTPEEMDAISIKHGSPLAPVMAFADARVDLPSGNVTVNPGVKDKTITHEIVHLKGLVEDSFNEGITDRIAATIYENSHARDDQYDAHGSAYGAQAEMLDTLEHLSKGKIDTYTLSYAYNAYGSKAVAENSAFLTHLIDNWAYNHIPLTIPMILDSHRTSAEYAGKYSHSVIVQTRQRIMADKVKLLDEAFFDADGNKIDHTLQTLVGRILSPDILSSHPQHQVMDVLADIAEAAKFMDMQPAKEGRTATPENPGETHNPTDFV